MKTTESDKEMTDKKAKPEQGTAGQETTLKPGLKGIRHFFAAFGYSMAGLAAAFKHEAAFRQELFLGVIHFTAMFLLDLDFEWCLYLTAVWVVLICFELVNSAIEAIVDMTSPGWHHLAKRAKDLGSATVFCMLVLYWGSWLFIALKLYQSYPSKM